MGEADRSFDVAAGVVSRGSGGFSDDAVDPACLEVRAQSPEYRFRGFFVGDLPTGFIVHWFSW